MVSLRIALSTDLFSGRYFFLVHFAYLTPRFPPPPIYSTHLPAVPPPAGTVVFSTYEPLFLHPRVSFSTYGPDVTLSFLLLERVSYVCVRSLLVPNLLIFLLLLPFPPDALLLLRASTSLSALL